MQKQTNMDKEKWIELFRAIGMDDAGMRKWHQEFEARFPEGHQAFLNWLHLPEHEISNIREQSISKSS